MKFSFTFLILLLIAVHGTGTSKMNPFKFRKATLERLNQARRIVASGDITKILEIVTFVDHFEALYKNRAFGPAANMYKLVWSRALEHAAFEYVRGNGWSGTKIGSTIHHKDFVGFHWMGDIMTVVDTVLTMLPSNLSSRFKEYLDIIETIVIVLWMGISIPTKLPLKEGEHYSAAEAVFDVRYEIGCYSNFMVSLCFMKNIPYQPRLFLPGAACSSCPTHCEFHVNDFGDNEDGELCVPPIGYYEKQKAEIAEVMNSCPGTSSIFLIALLVIIISMRK